jgi:hypothetical protein
MGKAARAGNSVSKNPTTEGATKKEKKKVSKNNF